MSDFFNRLNWAVKTIKKRPCPFVICWEDPDEPDAVLKIAFPTDSAFAFLTHGGVYPPLEAVMSGDPIRIHYASPIGPLSEQDALRYLMKRHIPRHVWDRDRSNRTYVQILHRSLIPKDRTHRKSWFLDETGTIGRPNPSKD